MVVPIRTILRVMASALPPALDELAAARRVGSAGGTSVTLAEAQSIAWAALESQVGPVRDALFGANHGAPPSSGLDDQADPEGCPLCGARPSLPAGAPMQFNRAQRLLKAATLARVASKTKHATQLLIGRLGDSDDADAAQALGEEIAGELDLRVNVHGVDVLDPEAEVLLLGLAGRVSANLRRALTLASRPAS